MAKRPDNHRNGGNGPFEADERLSAYLDGECTAAEQSELEARMAASPAFRQIVEELRSVRSGLELLPRHRLDDRFAERVLRRAERKVLLEDGASGEVCSDAKAAMETGGSSVLPARQERIWSARPFLWSVAALAAAILILVTQRDPDIRRDPIARGPAAPTLNRDKLAKKAEGEESALDKQQAAKLEDEKFSAGKQSELGAGGRDEQRLLESARMDYAEGGKAARAASLEAPAFRARRQPPADAPTAAPPQTAFEMPQDAQKDIVRLPSALEDGAARDATPALPVEKTSGDAPAHGVPLQATADNEQTDNKQADEEQLNQQRTFGVNAPQNGHSEKLGFSVSPGALPPPMRVVQVDVSREAWQRGAVEDVLARNGIVVIETDEALKASEPPGAPQRKPAGALPQPADARKGDDPKSNSAAAGAKVGRAFSGGPADRKPLDAVRAQAGQRFKADILKSEIAESVQEANTELSLGDGLDLLVVNATNSQIEGALHELQTAPEFQVVQMTVPSAANYLADRLPDNETKTFSAGAVPDPQALAPIRGGGAANVPGPQGAASSGIESRDAEETVGKKVENNGLGAEAGQRPLAESKTNPAGSASTATGDPKSTNRGRDATRGASPVRRSDDSRFARSNAGSSNGGTELKLTPSTAGKPAAGDASDAAAVEGVSEPATGKKRKTNVQSAAPTKDDAIDAASIKESGAAANATEASPADKRGNTARVKPPKAADPRTAADGTLGRDSRGAAGGYGYDRGGYESAGGGLGGSLGGRRRGGAIVGGGMGGRAGASGPSGTEPSAPTGSATRIRLLGRSTGQAQADAKALYLLRQHSDVVRVLEAQSKSGQVAQEKKSLAQSVEQDALAKNLTVTRRQSDANASASAALSEYEGRPIDPLATEQVLFFFRIVDAPPQVAAPRAESGEPVVTERAADSDRRGGNAVAPQVQDSAPVPAPANSAK